MSHPAFAFTRHLWFFRSRLASSSAHPAVDFEPRRLEVFDGPDAGTVAVIGGRGASFMLGGSLPCGSSTSRLMDTNPA
ncbi:MAG TPA: hypothetical protein VGQ80_07425 [Acidimicrobiia bacterium]|nr:hypothetical protein [Acidimicrobiia bacterium]